jgi:hypothetical protein
MSPSITARATWEPVWRDHPRHDDRHRQRCGMGDRLIVGSATVLVIEEFL